MVNGPRSLATRIRSGHRSVAVAGRHEGERASWNGTPILLASCWTLSTRWSSSSVYSPRALKSRAALLPDWLVRNHAVKAQDVDIEGDAAVVPQTIQMQRATAHWTRTATAVFVLWDLWRMRDGA